MKISLEREALLRQLQTVSRVASTRSAIQALSGFSSHGLAGRLRASSHRHGRRLACPGTRRGASARAWSCLPARLLLDVVRLLPAPAVSLELRASEQDVELVSGNATFHIRTLRAEDFPPFPEPEPSRR